MLQISQVKMRPDEDEGALRKEVLRRLHLKDGDLSGLTILRKSIDARRKPEIRYVYTVCAALRSAELERRILRRGRDRNITPAKEIRYEIPGRASGHGSYRKSSLRPVIIGTGPAGLFCGLALARAGLRPVLIERGQDVQSRTEAVQRFWDGDVLDPESNVQFGEGGAGTFSDGKLNTGVKDPCGRIRFVLDTFVEAGADPEIRYSYRPHIGTDVLKGAVSHIRDEIISRGGEVRFGEKLSALRREETASGTKIWNLELEKGGERHDMAAETVVLAVGHSARDTFRMLKDSGFRMSAKAFAVGLRIQHPQGMIDRALYGENCPYGMPPSPYRLTHRLSDGRGVYSFCMCPGGYVVNASSEPGELAVNGMSNHDRDSGAANSALVVTVRPEDIRRYMRAYKAYGGAGIQEGQLPAPGAYRVQADPGTGMPRPKEEIVCPDAGMQEGDVLEGIAFQRMLERAAYRAGEGAIPVQTFGAYRSDASSRAEADLSRTGQPFRPMFKGRYRSADVRSILPKEIGDAIEEGILAWDRQISGFADPSALLAGVESRTSSPVRIERDESLQAIGMPGVYPCGEGAGYAGGITSAAVDGLRVAEAVLAAERQG